LATRVLAVLGRLNRTAVFLAASALVFVALLVGGGLGTLALLALGAGLAALLIVSWSQLPAPGRAIRLVLLTMLVALAVVRLTA